MGESKFSAYRSVASPAVGGWGIKGTGGRKSPSRVQGQIPGGLGDNYQTRNSDISRLLSLSKED